MVRTMVEQKLEHDHTTEAIRRRLAQKPPVSYLRDFVYGGIDGAITTFAIVAGVEGAQLSFRALIILGLANLFADGLSMAAANYTGTKTEVDDYVRLKAIELKHIDQVPDGERAEVRELLRQKGLSGEPLNEAVKAITANDDRWVSFMLAEEYGLAGTLRSPARAAASTFVAFLICGLVPLIPFLFGWPSAAIISLLATAIVFFAIGSAKSRWSLTKWWMSGLETLAIGMAAATLAFAVGTVLKTMI